LLLQVEADIFSAVYHVFSSARTRLKEENNAAQKQRNYYEVGEQSDATCTVNVINIPSQPAINSDAWWSRKNPPCNQQNTLKRTNWLAEAQQRNFKYASYQHLAYPQVQQKFHDLAQKQLQA